MSRILKRSLAALALTTAIALPGAAQAQIACMPNSDAICVDQGSKWGNNSRKAFYSTDQGSQMIPYAWMQALKLPDNQPFMYDGLVRYGYIKDNFRSVLPIGFTLATPTRGPGKGVQQLGLTCAACHTRQIKVGNFEYRLDGGPALSDFQGLLTDMVDAVGRVLADPAEFDTFAAKVLNNPNPNATKKAALRQQVQTWFDREDTMRQRAYGTPDLWGLGRLDAVAMIFNRLTGLDIGEKPPHVIADNILPADAPVRYPFLWNAAIQDRTQWPGFSSNGSALTGLARNTGEVIGVFATFHPKEKFFALGGIDFTTESSVNFKGLHAVENLIKQIGAPRWPAQFPINKTIAAQGKAIYDSTCGGCHGIAPGEPAFPNIPTWKTPIIDVKTDTRENGILQRSSDPGVLIKLKSIFLPSLKVTNPTCSFTLLKYSVIGAIIGSPLDAIAPALAEDIRASYGQPKPPKKKDAKQVLDESMDDVKTCASTVPAYESRVMEGIWGAAPYLHNGSVPTLWDLLQTSDKRPASFAMGPNFDTARVGISQTQPGSYVMKTTGCATAAELNSGNSRCGHEGPGFGTDLSDTDKLKLLEYMKTL